MLDFGRAFCAIMGFFMGLFSIGAYALHMMRGLIKIALVELGQLYTLGEWNVLMQYIFSTSHYDEITHIDG